MRTRVRQFTRFAHTPTSNLLSQSPPPAPASSPLIQLRSSLAPASPCPSSARPRGRCRRVRVRRREWSPTAGTSERLLLAHVHVLDLLREDLHVGHQIGKRLAGSRHHFQHAQRGQDAVAGRGVDVAKQDMWPDCSPPSVAPVFSICSSTYLSPTGARSMPMPLRFSAASSPMFDMVVATTVSPCRRPCVFMSRAQPADSTASPFTTRPAASENSARSASPSKVMPRSYLPLEAATACATCSGCSAPQPALMLRPFGSMWRKSALMPQSAKHQRRDGAGSAVGAIDQHAQLAEVHARNKVSKPLCILLAQAGVAGKHLGRRYHVVGCAFRQLFDVGEDVGFDGMFQLIGELVAVCAEDLDAIVLPGIVRRRNHDAGGELVEARQIRNPRGRDHAGADHLDLCRLQPCRQSGANPCARLARVLADHGLRLARVANQVVPQCAPNQISAFPGKRKISRHSPNPVCPK